MVIQIKTKNNYEYTILKHITKKNNLSPKII